MGLLATRHELCAHLGAGRRKALGLIGGQQPWVVTQDIALLQVASDPDRWRVIDQVVGGKQLGINLMANLDGVAAVDEYGALVEGEDGQPPRTGETGEPAQPLRVGGHIFSLEFILAGNNQPRKFLFPEKFAGARRRGICRSSFPQLNLAEEELGKRIYLLPASTCSI